MRVLLVIFSLTCACLAGAQAPAPTNLFQTLSWNLLVKVQHQPSGISIVEVTPRFSTYPKDHLLSQIRSLESLTGSGARGMMVEDKNQITKGVRATFGIQNLMFPEKNVLGLEKVARAFAVDDKGKPNALMIQYESEVPNKKIVQEYRSKAVELQGQAHPVTGIEYRVRITTSNPNEISIPEGEAAQQPKAAPTPKPKESGIDWLIIGVVAIAALAVAALVYSLLLRPQAKRLK